MAKKANEKELVLTGARRELFERLEREHEARELAEKKRLAAAESKPNTETAEKNFKAVKVGDLVEVWHPELGVIPVGLVIDRVRVFLRKGKSKGQYQGDEVHVWSPMPVGTITEPDGKTANLHVIVCQLAGGAKISQVGQTIKLPAEVKSR